MLIAVVSAFAVTPVLLAGTPSTPMEHTAMDAGVAPWEITPVNLAVALPGPALLGAPPSVCAAPASLDELRESVRLAEKRQSEARFSVVLGMLAPPLAALGCLTVPAEATLIGRALFLVGYAELELGNADGAARDWRRALDFQPEMAWDANIDPERGALFRDLRAATPPPSARLDVGPGLGAVWVDGRAAAISEGAIALTVGTHLVQTVEPVQTWVLDAQADRPAALLDGRAIEAQNLGDPTLQPALAALVAARWPGERAYAWDGAQVWALDAGSWRALPASEHWGDAARERRAQTLWGAGLATTALGVGLTGTEVALLLAAQHRDPDGLGAAGAEDLEWRQRTANTRAAGVGIGAGVLGVGVALGGAGLWLGAHGTW